MTSCQPCLPSRAFTTTLILRALGPIFRGRALWSTIHAVGILCVPARAQTLPLANFQLADFAGSGNCGACHTTLVDEGGHDVSIDTHWRSTMMANSAKDPLWQAKMASEVARNPALKEVIEAKCATCHTPIARTQAGVFGVPVVLGDTGFLDPAHPYHVAAMDGVSCSLCHQLTPGNLGTPESFSGGYVVDTATVSPDRLIYGPFPSPFEQQMRNNLGFTPVHGTHTTASSLCAVCHNLYTPYVDSAGTVQGYFPEQMIYGEWEHSDYNDSPKAAECQDCHMPAAVGGVVLSNRGGMGMNLQRRSPFGQHHFVGGNDFMLGILADHSSELGITASAAQIQATRQRMETQLHEQTARLSATGMRVSSSGLEVDLLVENLAGHKFPAGFPSRRAWLHVVVTDHGGQVLFESGKPLANGRIEGNSADILADTCEPHYGIIRQPGEVQVYEAVMEDTDGLVTHTLLRGAAYRKDNRLLPAGFDTKTAPPDIAPVGAAVGDTDFLGGRDRITYQIATTGHEGPFEVTARLLYQSVAWSFAQDLFQEKDPAGIRMAGYYEAANHEPALIAETSLSLDPAQAYRLEAPQYLPDGTVRLFIYGAVDGEIAIDWSEDLINWQRLSTVHHTGELTQVSDESTPGIFPRFYRLTAP